MTSLLPSLRIKRVLAHCWKRLAGEEMPSSQSRDQLAGNEAKITVEVFLSSPHQVYIVDDALSSIYIISSTISMNKKIIFL